MLDPNPSEKPWLLFKKPVFQEGVNATVRLGNKWHFRAPPESIVEIRETTGDGYLFDAFIVDNLWLKICDIPIDVLQHEHDPNCRTHAGLIAELERVYRKKVSPRDKVTIILFEQCEPDPGEHDDPIEPPRVH
jgi:hypothetical protein